MTSLGVITIHTACVGRGVLTTEVSRDKKLLLVNVWDAGLGDLLHDYLEWGDSIGPS